MLVLGCEFGALYCVVVAPWNSGGNGVSYR